MYPTLPKMYREFFNFLQIILSIRYINILKIRVKLNFFLPHSSNSSISVAYFLQPTTESQEIKNNLISRVTLLGVGLYFVRITHLRFDEKHATPDLTNSEARQN
jgi:hypothetical protein